MGAYLNPDNDGFRTSLNSRIYVDKTDMIEYTMLDPGPFAKHVGFTEEVRELCAEYGMAFSEARQWYDGYRFFRAAHIYNPRTIVKSMLNEEFGNHWTATETYESLKEYIDLNSSEQRAK